MLQNWVALGRSPSRATFAICSTSPIFSSLTSAISIAAPVKSESRSPMSRHVRIAVVGDVHDDWDLEKDSKALRFLAADLVLFTGDFGNENVDLVKSVADLDFPKAVILGNHDCWRTFHFSRRKVDRVQLQLECLGDHHVGYCRRDFPMLNVSIVGCRPFSCGGKRLFREHLLAERYGINDMESSAKKIFEAAMEAPPDHALILLAHNGPKGLGDHADDICGVDWIPGGGDHGDPDLEDLAKAVADLKKAGRPINLVVFGHMHKELAGGVGERKMIVTVGSDEVYLNGALVPRVRMERRAFTVVQMADGQVRKVTETWVNVEGSEGEEVGIAEERVIFEGL